MSSIIAWSKLPRLALRNKAVLAVAVRNHWNKDMKPGPYPRTEEERRKAAEKYGLHPSEYEPYPDDGSGLGDYPKLPAISGEARDPNYPWDNPELKRNYQEPFHANFGLMREDRYDVTSRWRYPGYVYFVQFLGVMLGSFAIYYMFEKVKMFHPLVPRQYPTEGKKHYTFEKDE